MHKISVAGGFLVLSLAAARVDAQMVDAQTQVNLRDSVAGSAIAPVMALEGPGSEIGATVRQLRPDEAVAPGHGVVVESVAKDSPAARGGLKTGDIIFWARGMNIAEPKEFAGRVHDAPPGEVFPMAVVRDGVQMKITLVPEVARIGSSEQP